MRMSNIHMNETRPPTLSLFLISRRPQEGGGNITGQKRQPVQEFETPETGGRERCRGLREGGRTERAGGNAEDRVPF